MKVLSFEQFWANEFKKIAPKYANKPEVLVELKRLAEKTWEQALYTWNNAER